MSLGMTEPVSAECQEEEALPTPMASPGSSPTSLPPISHRSASSATRDVEAFLKKSATVKTEIIETGARTLELPLLVRSVVSAEG